MGVATAYDQRLLGRVSVAVAIWGMSYALFHGYYAASGTGFLPGRPADPAQFRLINTAAAAILTIAAVLPIAMLPLWRRPRARTVLLVLCWVIAVGCCVHALVDSIQRVLSLTGRSRIDHPTSV